MTAAEIEALAREGEPAVTDPNKHQNEQAEKLTDHQRVTHKRKMTVMVKDALRSFDILDRQEIIDDAKRELNEEDANKAAGKGSGPAV
jgi:hypothetical protein